MKFHKAQEGSMVLEASLIFPIFLLFILFLINMIRLTVVEITIHESVCTTTKQVATHLYPLNTIPWAEKAYGEFYFKVMGWLPAGPQEIMINFGAGVLKNRKDWAWNTTQNNTPGLTKVLLDYHSNQNLIDKSQLKVTNVIYPDIYSRDPALFGIETEYRMKLMVPFFSKEILLKHKAVERAWIGAPEKKKKV